MPQDRQDADVLIAGGGPAGLACALRLGRAGLRVTVLDRSLGQDPRTGRSHEPGDKVCGEGLMPLGLAELAALGLEPDSMPGSPFQGLRYGTGRREVALNFPDGLHGRGVQRSVLLQALSERAAALPTVRLQREQVRAPLWFGDRAGGKVRGVRGTQQDWHAPVVIAADGVHSPLLRQSPLRLRRQGARYALRQHFDLPGSAVRALQDRVWVGLFTPWEVYLTSVGARRVLATTMTHRAGYEAIRGNYAGFLNSTPFGTVFSGAALASSLLGWHHPLFVPERYHAGALLLAGDAGGGVDPCLGMGMSLALASARQAAEAALALHRCLGPWEAELSTFDASRRRLFNHYRHFGILFRLAVTSSTGSEALVWAMAQWPEAAETLLGCVAAAHPWHRLRLGQVLRPIGQRPRTGRRVKAGNGVAHTGPLRENP